eukprot:355589-Chlamydomonas_euryale.AAC.5
MAVRTGSGLARHLRAGVPRAVLRRAVWTFAGCGGVHTCGRATRRAAPREFSFRKSVAEESSSPRGGQQPGGAPRPPPAI